MKVPKAKGLLLLATLALSLRVGMVLALRTEHAVPVTYEHGPIAENLLAGRGFAVTFLGVEGPTSQQAPLYPALVAAAYWLFGIGSPQAVLALQLLQCMAGTGLVLAVVWLAWSLFPERPGLGWLAGAIAAVYPPHVYMVTHVQVAVWAALLLTLWMAAVFSPRWAGSRIGAAVAGVFAGLLLLVEPILVLAMPAAAWALWRTGRTQPLAQRPGRLASWGRVALMAVVAAIVVTPWLWRNYQVHGEFVFIKSTFGYAFWQGNNPASWGTDKIPKPSADALRQSHDGTPAGVDRAMWAARHETLYIDDVLLKPTGYREFAGLGEPARSRLLGRRAWEFIRAEPARYLGLCLQRLRYFVLFDETNPKAANLVYRLSTLAWLGMVLAGAISLRADWRRLAPIYAVCAAVTAFHALTIVSARFRIPIEPLLLPVAAASLRACETIEAGPWRKHGGDHRHNTGHGRLKP
ncbi:MAG: ArnT family glycosyltransferase [Pirellulales bacterium]